MSFSGAAFEKNFTVTAKTDSGAGASTPRTVSIKDRLGGGGGGGSGNSVSFAPTNEPRSIVDRLGGGGGGGGPPRGGGGHRYSDHDDRFTRQPYNDYDRPDRGDHNVNYRFVVCSRQLGA